MSLKDKVFAYIQNKGPQTNEELVAKFKVFKASMRRTCGELIHEGKLAPMPSNGARRYGLTSDARGASVPKNDIASKVQPLDEKDWRLTNFCF